MTITLKTALALTVILALVRLAPAGDAPTKADIPQNVTPELKALLEQTFSPDPKKRAEAATRLGGMPEKATTTVPFLIRLLGDRAIISDSTYEAVWHTAAKSLGTIGPAAVEPVLVALRRSEDGRRFELLLSLGSLKDQRVVAEYLSLMDDPDDRISQRAAEGLKFYLRNNPSFRKLPGLTQSLVRATQHKDQRIRGDVVTALGECRDPAAFEPLMKMLKDSDPRVRREAITALGDLGDPRARDTLKEMTRNASRMVDIYGGDGAAAARSLGQLGGGKDVAFFLVDRLRTQEESVKIRCGAVSGLAELGEHAVLDELVDILNNKVGQPCELRKSIVWAIARLEGRKAAPILKQRALDSMEARGVCIIAALALTQVTDGEIDDIAIVDLVDDGAGYDIESVSALKQIAKHGKTKEIREAAQKRLAQNDSPSVPGGKSEKE
jgi:HEAT repeat protein